MFEWLHSPKILFTFLSVGGFCLLLLMEWRGVKNFKKMVLLAGAKRTSMFLPKAEFGPPWEGYRIESRQGDAASTPYYGISAPCPHIPPFKINRENALTRFAASTGISRKIRTGDLQFDGEFFIRTDYPRETIPLFSSAEIRREFTQIFRMGCREIKTNGKRMVIKWEKAGNKFENPEFIPISLAVLKNILEGFPPDSRRITFGWDKVNLLRYGFVFAPLFLGIPSIIFASKCPGKALNENALLLDCLIFGLFPALTYIFLLFPFFRNRTSTHEDMFGIIMLALLFFPLNTFLVGGYLNQTLDDHPPTIHWEKVVKKTKKEFKGNIHYTLFFNSWKEPNEEYELLVPSEDYYPVSTGKTVLELVVKPGRFGHEWIESYRIFNGASDFKPILNIGKGITIGN